MANTLINVIEVKVIGNQTVTIYIAPYANSTIYTRSGQTILQPNGTVTAEDNRFDQGQLEQMQRNKLIQFTRGQRVVAVTPSPGTTGSS